jgi:hypothetical protein
MPNFLSFLFYVFIQKSVVELEHGKLLGLCLTLITPEIRFSRNTKFTEHKYRDQCEANLRGSEVTPGIVVEF